MLYSVVGTGKHLGIDRFRYLREALPALLALGDKPALEQRPEWLPERWWRRQARASPRVPAAAG